MVLAERLIRKVGPSANRFCFRLAGFTLGVATLAVVAGCKTEPSDFRSPPPATSHSLRPVIPEAITNSVSNTNASATITRPRLPAYILREGDVLKITFPGSPNLNSVQQIRTDGKITLPLIGEVNAAGLTPNTLQKKLIDLYAPQLSTKEVTVEVQSSSFPVYVTGAVLHPGKISSDHPITALEAIMEAGGFNYVTANLKDVTVIRQEGDRTKRYIVNLKRAMEGKTGEPFYLKPADIIYVPEKFSWF